MHRTFLGFFREKKKICRKDEGLCGAYGCAHNIIFLWGKISWRDDLPASEKKKKRIAERSCDLSCTERKIIIMIINLTNEIYIYIYCPLCVLFPSYSKVEMSVFFFISLYRRLYIYSNGN